VVAIPPTRVVIVDDTLESVQDLCHTMTRAFGSVRTAISWEHAEKFDAVDKESFLIIPMTHSLALHLPERKWDRVTAVLIDTHEAGREWHRGLRNGELPQPVYAGGEVARKILALGPSRPRVICYSEQLDNPLVKVFLWQQTGNGAADGYYMAESLRNPAVVRSAILGSPSMEQVSHPTDRDFALLGLTSQAPLYRIFADAHDNRERWELVSGLRTYRDASGAAKRWLTRKAADLGTGEPGRKGRGASVLTVLRRAASGRHREL
jgi:hypothetical protein